MRVHMYAYPSIKDTEVQLVQSDDESTLIVFHCHTVLFHYDCDHMCQLHTFASHHSRPAIEQMDCMQSTLALCSNPHSMTLQDNSLKIDG